MSATTPRPAPSHADVSTYRRPAWVPADSGIDELDAMHAEHEADVAAAEAARQRVNDLAAGHREHEGRVRESAIARARGEDVAVVKPLPEAARQQELTLARVDADAAVALLDERNARRRAVIAQRADAWVATFEARIASGEEQIGALLEQVEAIRRKQRANVIGIEWVLRSDDDRDPIGYAALLDAQLGAARVQSMAALGPHEARDALDRPLRRATGRLSDSERMTAAMHSAMPPPDDAERPGPTADPAARAAVHDPGLSDRVASALADLDEDEPDEPHDDEAVDDGDDAA